MYIFSKRTIGMALLLPLFLAVFALFSPAAIGTASAHSAVVQKAAASCSNSKCDGLNPITEGCTSNPYATSQAKVTHTFSSYGGGTIYLMFGANACHAVWGVIIFNNAIPSGHEGNAVVIGSTDSESCDPAGDGVVAPGQHGCYTGMVSDNASQTADTCGTYDGGLLGCTATW